MNSYHARLLGSGILATSKLTSGWVFILKVRTHGRVGHWLGSDKYEYCKSLIGVYWDPTYQLSALEAHPLTDLQIAFFITGGWDVAQEVEHSAEKIGIIRSSLHGRCTCNLGYFPFQPVVYSWSIKACGMCCPVCGKVHMHCCNKQQRPFAAYRKDSP